VGGGGQAGAGDWNGLDGWWGILQDSVRPCVIMGDEDEGRNKSINNGGKAKNVGWGDQGEG
jgi:hypothetical protein